MNDSIIKIENLTKYYDGRAVLDNVSFEIPQGCIYGLLGRNGAGKTTIIRILLGLEPVTRGSTFIFGKSSNELGADHYGKIGYVLAKIAAGLDGLSRMLVITAKLTGR